MILLSGSNLNSMGCDLSKGGCIMCYPIKKLNMDMLRNATGFVKDNTQLLIFVVLGLGLVADFAT